MRRKKEEDLEDDELEDEIVEDDPDKLEEDELEDDLDAEGEDDLLDDDFGDDFGGGEGIPTMEKHNDLLKELTSFDKFIKDKINGWLGLTWSEQKQTYVRNEEITPIMNSKCAAWCADYLKTYTRNNNIITHISQLEYNNLNEDIIEVLWKNLGTRSEEFGIQNNGDILRICVEMEHASILVLMGAGDGKYSNLLKESVHRNENVSFAGNPNQPQQLLSIQPNRKDSFLKRMGQALNVNGGR